MTCRPWTTTTCGADARSTHRAFDEATAILAADALQPLAFEVLATAPAMADDPAAQVRLVALLAESLRTRMALPAGRPWTWPPKSSDSTLPNSNTCSGSRPAGCCAPASSAAAHCAPDITIERLHRLEIFADALGIAYQIRDDVLDFTAPGHAQSSDAVKAKATYPALFGLEKAIARADRLRAKALDALSDIGSPAEGLRWMTSYTMARSV